MQMGQDALYWRVMNGVLDRVRDGTYPPGGRLPSERAMVETLSVSRSTISRVMTHLRWIGLITGPQGGIARVATEPRRSRALAIVDEIERIRSMPE